MQTRSQISKILLLSLILLAGHAATPAAVIQPPPNDLCQGAEVIPPSGPFPYSSPVIPRIIAASTNGDPVLPALFLQECATNVQQSVWYCFTPSASGLYTFSTGLDTATSVPDTVMGLFTASTPCGPLTLYACNDDSGTVRASISTNLAAGTLYYILVWVGEAHLGQVLPPDQSTVQLRVTRPLAPVNDACAGAIDVPPSGPFPYVTTPVDLTLATDDGDQAPVCAGFRGVWFTFTPASSGTYILSTGPETQTTVSDTSMAVYTSSTSDCGGMFALQACSSGLGTSLRGVVVRAMAAGTKFFILVWDETAETNETAGSIIPGETQVQLRVQRSGPPAILSAAATGIASTGAVLRAVVSPTAQLSRSWMEWGLTTAYTATTMVNTMLAGTGGVTNAAAIAGLTADTTYHFRVVATNSSGRTNGPDLTFRYSTNRPVLTTPERMAGGFFRFEFTGNPGQLYLARNNTDVGAVSNWVDLDVASEITNGLFEFIHARPGNAPHRTYQLRGP